MIYTLTLLYPVFGIIAVGYLLCRYRFVKSSWVEKLNYFIYYVSLPAIIISLFWKIEFTKTTISYFGFHAVVITVFSLLLIAFLSLFSINRKTKIAVVLGAMVGNTVYMGYPILKSAFPTLPVEVGMGAGTVQLIVGLLTTVFLVEILIQKADKFSAYFLDLIKNPLIIAFVVGAILSFIPHNTTSDTIFNFISYVGQTASPLALFTLGVFMNRKFSKQSWLLGGLAIGAKLVLLPLVVLLASLLLGYNKEFIQMSVLISAMPTAITSFILAEKYHLNNELAADIILVSTVLSIVSLPIVIWLLG